MFKKIYKKMKNNDIEVYSLGQHKGVCNSPFVVIKEYEPTEVVGRNYYNNTVELVCLYPLGSYTLVKEFKDRIETIMDGLKEFDRVLLGNPIMVDNDKQAYLFVLQYNNKKLRRY